MSSSEVERFVGDLKSDEGLRSALSDHASGVGSVVSFANDKGYDISVDEANSYIQGQANQDLSDDQLDAVAGGKGSGHVGTTVQTAVSTTTAATVAEAVAVIVLT